MNSNLKPEPVRVIGPLRSRVNALAHRLALSDELRHRATLLDRLGKLAADGKGLSELHAELDDLEHR